MAFAIGLRFYRIIVRKKGSEEHLLIGPAESPCDLFDYFGDFIAQRNTPTNHEAEERSWLFEPAITNDIRTHDGTIIYGTHGFESKIRDGKTGRQKYHRQRSDLEDIPLYYQFWLPDNNRYGLLAFQSFGGKSCISLIRKAIQDDFKLLYGEYTLHIVALAPSRSMMDAAPVKSVTFYGTGHGRDRINRLRKAQDVGVNYELTVRVQKRGTFLGSYRDVRDEFGQDPSGVVTFDDQEFGGVSADIQFGGRRRTVGVFGAGHEPGLIDVSDDVKRDRTGHPTLVSIRAQTNELMETFFASALT